MSLPAVSHPWYATDDAMASPAAERFRALVASPLRAELLRFLHAHQDDTFEIESLMGAAGCMRADAERCLESLVSSGVARRWSNGTQRFGAARPANPTVDRLLTAFLLMPAPERARTEPVSVRKLLELVGRDEKMLLVLESIRTAAKTDISVLILGPTGAGKEVAAKAIHDLSRRQARPFQAVSCAAVPDSLFEAEVFGHEKGAFTGAHERRLGRVELANRGTLFLDEIGDLALLSQAKLLRVLEERQVERLGGRTGIDVDFRLISATNRPLETLVNERRFREDLYYRINAFTIRMPALKERPEDVPLLARMFLEKQCAADGLSADARRFTNSALSRLSEHAWPGNIRELIATVSRAALSADGPVIDDRHIGFLALNTSIDAEPTNGPGIRPLADVERDHIQAALSATGWNKKETARLLQISRETLYRKIRTFQLCDRSDVHP
jgi:two-component system, NtrC family, response regulator HydG